VNVQPGDRASDLDTPVLLVDLDPLEHNIQTMADFFRDRPAHLRPHVKSHKMPAIARLQVAAGAPGVCAAKLGEAEAMVEGGIDDVLIANEVVGDMKMERLLALAERARIAVAVDHSDNVAALSRAAHARGVALVVLVELDIGMNRCGVNTADEALALARLVIDSPGLEFRGLMGYEGHVMGVKDAGERARACRASMQRVTDAAEYLRAAGVPVEEVSGGGTLTYDVSGTYPGMTEIQCGSYALMDTNFRDMGSPFQCAMTLLTTVMSLPRPGVAIADAGMKTITNDFGLPEVKNGPGLTLERLSEEHARLSVADSAGIDLGEKVELLPSHGCTTVNLHDRAYAVRDGRVVEVWDVAGRGRSQ
jgi:D-serine deaminase-like pyridoxal phosphate-dependent protein